MHTPRNFFRAFAFACAAFTSTHAAAVGADGLFVEARFGSSSADFGPLDDDANAAQLIGGYRWNGFGVEVGYVDFGSLSNGVTQSITDVATGATTTIPGTLDAGFEGYTIGASARENFGTSPWYLTGRLGFFVWDVDVTTRFPDSPRGRANGDGTDWYAGLGVGYDFSDRFSVGASYDHFRVESDDTDGRLGALSLTGEVRF